MTNGHNVRQPSRPRLSQGLAHPEQYRWHSNEVMTIERAVALGDRK